MLYQLYANRKRMSNAEWMRMCIACGLDKHRTCEVELLSCWQ